MTKERILEQIEKESRSWMAKVKIPGHDFKHIDRVREIALKIAKKEKVDLLLVEVAVLLHDIGRYKEKTKVSHGKISARIAQKILNRYKEIKQNEKKQIIQAIKDHDQPFVREKLGQILQDADKVDGLGAIGIARCFSSVYYLPDYNPKRPFISPKYRKINGKRYIDKKSIKSIADNLFMQMNFYKMLYTETAKKLAKKRYLYMKNFVERIRKEIAGIE